MTDLLRIEKRWADYAVSGFDCGQEELNRFLSRFALVNLRAGAAQTYVALSGETIVGDDSLAVGEVADQDAPERLTKGLARHAVPIMLLARLAVRAEPRVDTGAARGGSRAWTRTVRLPLCRSLGNTKYLFTRNPD